jgi:outer membrane protein TolC
MLSYKGPSAAQKFTLRIGFAFVLSASVTGCVGSQALVPAHLFEQQGFRSVSVVGLRWRLFDFGTVAAEVKQARGANAEALLQYRSPVLHAAEDVEDAFSLLVLSENRRNEILREIAELQRVRDRSEESYAAGVIPLTDVLDANRQLLVAKDDLAVARESAARAAIGSYRALGGGWLP